MATKPLPSPAVGDIFTTISGQWMVTALPNAASLDHADVIAGPLREWAWQTHFCSKSADAVTLIMRDKKQIYP